MRKRSERGEGNFGCLVGLVLLLIAGLVAYKMIPVKVKAADMRDTVVDEAKSAGLHDDRAIHAAIMDKAHELELPITDDDVVIERRNSMIRVDVKYTVPVQFPGYVYKWNFEHKAENPIF
ncbi:MAG: hypothetical protein JO315_14470 [Acidobacteria bacterium]|nr:hypothetical protein [Acidobacteriota bacterium]